MTADERGARPDTDSGFTLLETLIALAVLTGLLVVLGTGVTGGWRGVAAAEADKRALAVAHALIEETGIVTPLATGTREGITAAGNTWRLSVTPYRPSGADQRDELATAYWVTASVTPRGATGNARRPLVLRTLKVVPP